MTLCPSCRSPNSVWLRRARAQSCLVLLLFFNWFISSGHSQPLCPAEGETPDIRSCGTGQCIPIDGQQGKFACLCLSGHAPTGPSDFKCQPVNACTSEWTKDRVCFNGGSCVSSGNQVSQYTCTCAPGYYGQNCQRKANACDRAGKMKCQNAGTCIPQREKGPDAFYCLCPPKYTGEFCEAQISLGVGSSGVALTVVQLIFGWAIWIMAAITFLYCSVNMLIAWWFNLWKKKGAAAVSS